MTRYLRFIGAIWLIHSAHASTYITNLPYTISSPGDYILGHTMVTTSGVAISINANDVNLDLNSNSLVGDNTDPLTAFGIVASNATNIIVKNGTIDGFRVSGLVLNGVTKASIKNLVIQNINNTGIWTGLFAANTVSGFLASSSYDISLSHVSIENITLQDSNDVTLSEAGGVIAESCANMTNEHVIINGVSNNCGIGEGFGILDCTGTTILKSTVTNIATGEEATNSFLGHTCLGMVFSPSRLSCYILGATVINGGSGYSGIPEVSISAVTNDDGTSGGGYATVSPAGQITSIVITNIGWNYETFPQVTITGTGTGATATVLPNQVGYATIGYCGNIRVEDCDIGNITGGIDDAHGISLFTVTDAVLKHVHVNGVTDGVNSLGIGGSKATGFENYGDPSAADCNITLEDCSAKNITAIGPADLAANGFSAAGNGISFIRCTASNVKVTGINRLDPPASPGTGTGFGWAPDVRIQNIYPANNAFIQGCTASGCQVGFDTFNFQNSRWNADKTKSDGIDYLQEPFGTVRTVYGSLWNEVVDAGSYPYGIKPIPIYNYAGGNSIR